MAGTRWYSLKCDDCGLETFPRRARGEIGVSSLRKKFKKCGWRVYDSYELDGCDFCPRCKRKAFNR